MTVRISVYCCICGGPLGGIESLNPAELGEDEQYLIDGAYDSRLLPAVQSEWINDYQVFGRTIDLGKICESPVFNKSSDPDVFISGEGEWDYQLGPDMSIPKSSDPTGDKKSVPLYDKSSFFPSHTACLGVLERFCQCATGNHIHQPVTITDFINAYAARDGYFSDFREVARKRQQPVNFPWRDILAFCHKWSHLYFGSVRYWADPWESVPGAEYLCADPLRDPQASDFISTCLRKVPRKISATSPHFSTPPDNAFSKNSPLTHCPPEIIQMIAYQLPLRSALNLYATSRAVVSLLSPLDAVFWRERTLRLHGDWLWELYNFEAIPFGASWRTLLQALTAARRQILTGANPYWIEDSETSELGTDLKDEGDVTLTDSADSPLPALPIGLKNRQRIWMCLECVGMDGSQKSLCGLKDEVLS